MRPIVVAVSTLLDTLRRRTVSSRTVPVFLAGMWPSTPGVPDSGTRVALAEKGGGSVLLQGFSDPSGAFRGRLPKTWVGKDVCVIVREPSFKFHYANPVRVERWGLFLAIRQEQDRVHSVSEDSKCARSLDPGRWEKWDSMQEYIRAQQAVIQAARRAKIVYLRVVGLVLALVIGGTGFVAHPGVGLLVGVAAYLAMELLTQFLLARGY
jgi:hypothetical protein